SWTGPSPVRAGPGRHVNVEGLLAKVPFALRIHGTVRAEDDLEPVRAHIGHAVVVLRIQFMNGRRRSENAAGTAPAYIDVHVAADVAREVEKRAPLRGDQ